MLTALAVLASVWVAWRLIGLATGLRRATRFTHQTKSEARRAVMSFAAITVFWAVLAVYAWAFAMELQPTDAMTGFLAATLIGSLVGGMAARLMQPPARLPHTVGICRVMYGRPDTPVQPVGRVVGTDESGVYQTTLVSAIQAPWDAAVEDYARLLAQQLGGSIHSVYVRGSIASGTAQEGIADLDGIVVLRDHDAPQPGLNQEIERAITARHPAIAATEVLAVGLEDILASGGRNGLAFLLATQSLCVEGTDLRAELPSFGFGPWVFAHAPHLSGEIDELFGELAEESSEERRHSCSWIMRRIVRTGFEAVIAHEDGHTRDLYPCFEAFRRHYPDRADEMWRALELAVEPTGDLEVITELCQDLGKWVAEEASVVYRRALEAAHG